MAEYFALQAALCFSLSHILIRRGLVTSNAITGSAISIAVSAVTLWILVPFFVPLASFFTHAIWYFIVGGVFAPGLGRTLTYMGIERIGVARSVPISSSSPIVASLLAVLLIGESWSRLNFIGTSLVICGVFILSRSQTTQRPWRKADLIFPILAACSFGISTNLRKLGLMVENLPLMGSAVTATTAFFFTAVTLKAQGGRLMLNLSGNSLGWFLAAGIANTIAMLSVFYALSFGQVVIVEPLINTNPVLTVILSAIFLRDIEAITLRVVAGAICTVLGTILVVAS